MKTDRPLFGLDNWLEYNQKATRTDPLMLAIKKVHKELDSVDKDIAAMKASCQRLPLVTVEPPLRTREELIAYIESLNLCQITPLNVIPRQKH